MAVVGGQFDNDAVRDVVVVDVVEFVVVVVLPVVFVVDLLVGEAMQIGAETFGGIVEGAHDVVDKARLRVAKTRGVDGIRSKIVEMVAA